MVPGPAALDENLLEMQVLSTHPRPTESETLSVGEAQQSVFTRPAGDSDAH